MNTHQQRRTGGDRRARDIGPPSGWRDRRRSVERRAPEVGELAVSDDDWAKYFGGMVRPQAANVFAETGNALDTASAVFDKVRD